MERRFARRAGWDNVTLFTRLHSVPVVGRFCVVLERGYTRVLAAVWRVDATALFDPYYYDCMNPDVAAAGIDPLFQFLRYGAKEGRQPHPLFDPRYYLERYPDVARSGLNPLLHFLRFGGLEGRCPHPDFDSAFYLAGNPDVAAARRNPLVHFLSHGAVEGRRPHPDFDPEFYLSGNPDVAAAGLDPLVHFARYGAAEGRQTHARPKRNPPPESFLPVAAHPPRPAPAREIDVIIPAYKGVAETEACLESVLSSRCSVRFRVVVVNDCSPEPELSEHLRRMAREGRITLIENQQNQGFVRSANEGMRASGRDVVLLNSDTLVFGDWLDRLQACAYAEERTATVTPFSNNATICSYPGFCADNRLSASIDLAALDAVFASVNRGRSVDIPTAVGFCMYIRRECLEEAGLFDADAFGTGYGEENDFCMRTAAAGWKQKLACDVFVYHAGSVSFGEASARQQAAMRTMISRHPNYPALVSAHIQADPANAFRIAVTARRIRDSGKRVFLSVVHALGGGVAEHARQLAALTGTSAVWLTLRPFSPGACILECAHEDFRFSLLLDAQREHETLAAIIRACGTERIHIHHLMEHAAELGWLVQDLGLPFDFTIHDYYTICPQVTLSDEHGRYCGERGEESCNRCMEQRPPRNGLVDISSWRVAHAWALLGADRVIAPSADAAARMARYYPEARVVAAEHAAISSWRMATPRTMELSERLRIVVLGTQTIHKGYELFRKCAEIAASRESPLEFILVGSVETGIPRGRTEFTETGRYEQADLPAILERVAAHIVWFPTRVPETFSYTLSASLALGLPVAAHDLGAFPERLGGRPWSWILPLDTSAERWAAFFLHVRQEHFLAGKPPVPPASPERATSDFYPDGYLATARANIVNRHRMHRQAQRPIRIAAAVASSGGQIQACGYVRVIQPLTHPALADTVQLTLRLPRDLPSAEADVILVQRVAIEDMETAERVVEACRRRGCRLVFEIDDDLFHIPPEHPESRHYLRITEAARWLAGKADAVLTPTEGLRRSMLAFHPNTIVLPNFLDERLWLPPSEPALFHPDEIRVLYAGTVSHRDDLEFVGQAVRALRREYREKIRLDIVGVAQESSNWFHALPVPRTVAGSFPRFVEWLRARNVWHWGIAPLLDTPFNQAKSALKFLEYSALGLASICSDISVYREAVQPGQTGILAANDPQVWREAFETVLADEAVWSRLRKNSQSMVLGKTIAARAEDIKALWTALAAGASLSAAPAATLTRTAGTSN